MEGKGFLDDLFHEILYPGLAIVGACAIIAYMGGGIQFTSKRNAIAQASAQQTSSHQVQRKPSGWSLDSLLVHTLLQHPGEFYEERGGYYLTPEAIRALARYSSEYSGAYSEETQGEVRAYPDTIKVPVLSRYWLFNKAVAVSNNPVITSDKVELAYRRYVDEAFAQQSKK